MKLYFAGSENAKYEEVLQKCGATNRLQSAFYLNYRSVPNSHNFKNYLLDSGGFTAITKGIDLDLKTYINFLNKYKVKIAFSLDVPDVEKTVKNTYELKRSCDTQIIPVYHDMDYFSKHRFILEKYLTDFNYISIAGLTRNNYKRAKRIEFGNYLFNHTRDKIKVHGLAVTASSWMKMYPFYSVDSTSWLSAARYGRSQTLKSNILNKYRAKHVHYLKLCEVEIKHWLKVEKQITELWGARGIKWND